MRLMVYMRVVLVIQPGRLGQWLSSWGKECTWPLYVKVTGEFVQTYHWCTWKEITVKREYGQDMLSPSKY
jgi:hypothetical protein